MYRQHCILDFGTFVHTEMGWTSRVTELLMWTPNEVRQGYWSKCPHLEKVQLHN